jgi:phage shock protein C
MFCAHCGKEADFSARFCSSCGASLSRSAARRQGRIERPRSPRLIAGVCLGFAIHYGWDVSLVRILSLVFIVATSGLGVLLYLAAWIILPDAQYALTSQSPGGTAG